MNRIGVFICECGSNIKDKVDIAKVITEVSKLKDVAVAEQYRLLCSQEGRSYLEERIRKEALTHVVVAACSPREHLQTFMTILEKASINPYMLQMVNIREQCAWVTEKPDDATKKATRMIRAAVGRVRFQSPLQRRQLSVNPNVLVLGGGVSGIETCLILASQGRKTYLIEREPMLGGVICSLARTYPGMDDPLPRLEEKIEQLRANPFVEVLTEHRLERVLGFFGNFEVTVRPVKEGGDVRTVKVGSLVIATGAQLFDPNQMRSYDRRGLSNVLTPLEFEDLFRSGSIKLKDGREPRSVGIVHCVGREVKGYCSGVCCMYGLKFSRYLREKLPNVKITHLYWDLNIPGRGQQAYFEETLQSDIEMVRVSDVHIRKREEDTVITFFKESGVETEMRPDLIVLLTALEPRADARELARLATINLDEAGFFARTNPKLNPVGTTVSGIYVVGTAQGPVDSTRSVVQAQAAAGQILASLVPGRKMEIEAKTSSITESLCQGCKSCINVCPFGVITFNEQRKVAVVNEAICRGCGNCAAACPSGAASVKHFTYDQIYQEIEEAMK